MDGTSLSIKETKNGKGVIAEGDFNAGEVIIQFKGKFFTGEEVPHPYEHDYFLQIDKNLYLGPSGEADDYFNHSCSPNAAVTIDGRQATLIAIQPIKKGDEITFDYSTTMDEDDWEMTCNCGNPFCRGQIRDFKQLPLETQKKYLDLGIVAEYLTTQQSTTNR